MLLDIRYYCRILKCSVPLRGIRHVMWRILSCFTYILWLYFNIFTNLKSILIQTFHVYNNFCIQFLYSDIIHVTFGHLFCHLFMLFGLKQSKKEELSSLYPVESRQWTTAAVVNLLEAKREVQTDRWTHNSKCEYVELYATACYINL